VGDSESARTRAGRCRGLSTVGRDLAVERRLLRGTSRSLSLSHTHPLSLSISLSLSLEEAFRESKKKQLEEARAAARSGANASEGRLCEGRRVGDTLPRGCFVKRASQNITTRLGYTKYYYTVGIRFTKHFRGGVSPCSTFRRHSCGRRAVRTFPGFGGAADDCEQRVETGPCEMRFRGVVLWRAWLAGHALCGHPRVSGDD